MTQSKEAYQRLFLDAELLAVVQKVDEHQVPRESHLWASEQQVTFPCRYSLCLPPWQVLLYSLA